MKHSGILSILIALVLIVSLSACGDSRVTSAGALISGYFNIGEQNKGDLAVLGVEPMQNGYYAAALYTGSGSHLVLFKIEKGADNKEKITASCEGSAASAWDCSVNLVEDGGKTIIFGNIKAEAQQKKYSKISIVFEDGSAASKPISGGACFIIIVDGTQKIKDFSLSAQGQTVGYKELLGAGGSLLRTTFQAVK